MRKLFLLAAVLFFAALPARAQSGGNYPGIEIFGGYSYMNTKFADRHSLNGWGASAAFNLGSHWGLVGDFSGNYGHIDLSELSGDPLDVGTSIGFSKYAYLAGPQYSARSKAVTGFAHVLVGGVSTKFSGASQSSSGFALGLGGGVDVNVGKSLGVRLFQVDYLPEHSLGIWTNNVRLQAGLVFRIGS